LSNKEENETAQYSNGNANKTKAEKSFDNGVFFASEVKQTCSIIRTIIVQGFIQYSTQCSVVNSL
jgi:hypothetical protein